MDKLILGGCEFGSRLFLGTGKFSSNTLMGEAISASGTEMVTVAMKRIELGDKEDDMLKHIKGENVRLLPNTSGVRDAEEAVFAAQMAREAFGTEWLKLEIHPDPRYLLPDSTETLKATEKLVKMGFIVLPYCQADPVLCKRLEEAGAAAVMPLGAPIGSNQGLRTKDFLRIIIEQAGVPRSTCSSGCRHRSAEPCSRSNGTRSLGMPCQHGNRRGWRSCCNGKSLQDRRRSGQNGL